MVRAGLISLLQGAGYRIGGEADDCRNTLNHPLLSECSLVIVDLALGDESGIDLIKKLRQLALSVLVYSMHEDSNIIRNALDAGAMGYVTKRETFDSLLNAVQSILDGKLFVSPRAATSLDRQQPFEVLTGQQMRIYHLIARGMSNDEIAKDLQISVRTVESYSVRIMDKLNLQSMRELRRQAIESAARLQPTSGSTSLLGRMRGK